MQEFDPRDPPARYAPRVFACLAGVAVLAAAWQVLWGNERHVGGLPFLDAATVAALRSEAFARAEAHPASIRPPQFNVRSASNEAVDGALKIETTVAQGRMSDSLYDSALAAGATPELTAQAVQLFAHKLDFSRDLHAGDRFRLVFDRGAADLGHAAKASELLYAEIATDGEVTRVYRYQPAGAAQAEFFDELGRNIRSFLLQTPVDGARISSGFGERLHPILGYTRLHQGIDFAAPVGAPVYAAGDGVVEEARWAGGYGRWLKIRHGAEWETGYGHLSGWAVRPGEHVHQGQVVAYVGATGEATGPHLHYEVMMDGRKINPKGAKSPLGVALEGRELAAFKAEEAHVDVLLASAPPNVAVQLAQADTPNAAQIALRASQDLSPDAGLRLALQ
jgi:murein DD-endopeptidase MepM/ murein hydrolase activator NlpD